MKRKPVIPTRVVLADDHPLILASLSNLLGAVPGMDVVAKARSGVELLARLGATECDVVVTDYSMPGRAMDGFALVRRLASDFPALPVVIVTMMSNPAVHVALMESGASALVDKASNVRDVVTAVQTVRRGGKYVSTTFKRRMANFAKGKGGPAVTPKEAEVLRLIVAGFSVSAAAKQCARSIKTVSRQKLDGMKKLGLNSEAELFEYAREYGLR